MDESNCNYNCPGNQLQKCGGKSANSIWKANPFNLTTATIPATTITMTQPIPLNVFSSGKIA